MALNAGSASIPTVPEIALSLYRIMCPRSRTANFTQAP
jgi:hypothetical protein